MDQACLAPTIRAVCPAHDDASLMAAVGAGSGSAFGILAERHSPGLRRLATRMLGDSTEAEDVVQDCLVRLWRHAPVWQPCGAGLVGWLHRVTTNLCHDRLRRSRLVTMPDLPETIDEAPLADSLIEAEQAVAHLVHALASLPERHRTALVLCYLEDHSNAAAAAKLDLHIKAMESLLLRARRRLRSALEAQTPPIAHRAA